LAHWGIYLHWGRPASAEGSHNKQHDGNNKKDMVESGEGEFRFERKHFPADARTDCWFCLASPACEKHLIVGVFDSCYAAQPKGPCHPGHVLLVPVQHDSSGALTNATVSREMDDLKRRLQRHAGAEYDDADLFIFERAMQTKGGYHTHVQCIPVPKGAGPKIRVTLLAQASRQKFDLREISSDIPMHTIVGGEDGYFFAEIMTAKTSERYLYSAAAATATTTAGPPRVPLQFGREVLAAVLEQPDLAHWKSCVLDEDKEAEAAAEFRKSFAKYVDAD
jgi:diadenosine tetraphosphate (Ap4A) HIT family hydrolase